MEAGQPKLGGHVLPKVDQAGNDPVIPRHTHFLSFTALLFGLFPRSAISSSSVDALYPTTFVHHGFDVRTSRAVKCCCSTVVGILCAVPCIIATDDTLDFDTLLPALRCQPSRKADCKNCPASCPGRAAKDRVVPVPWTREMGRTDHHPTFLEPAVQQPTFQVLEGRVASVHLYPSKGWGAARGQLYRTRKRRSSSRLMQAVEV